MNVPPILRMKVLVWVIPAILFVAVSYCIWRFATPDFVKLYQDKMRPSLFTGFFTLSGFLLSAKAFIILNLKKELYSTDTYLNYVKDQTPLAKDKRINVYDPLRDIGRVLIINVALCLTSSILQFSLGLVDDTLAVAGCLSVAVAAAGMLAFSLFIIGRNLHNMYDHFESEAQDKLKKMKEEAAKKGQ